jgi:hypothetical protein
VVDALPAGAVAADGVVTMDTLYTAALQHRQRGTGARPVSPLYITKKVAGGYSSPTIKICVIRRRGGLATAEDELLPFPVGRPLPFEAAYANKGHEELGELRVKYAREECPGWAQQPHSTGTRVYAGPVPFTFDVVAVTSINSFEEVRDGAYRDVYSSEPDAIPHQRVYIPGVLCEQCVVAALPMSEHRFNNGGLLKPGGEGQRGDLVLRFSARQPAPSQAPLAN